MTSKTKDLSERITLTAVWGNEDADSCTSLSYDEWLDICGGGELLRREVSYYEGEEFEVCWAIEDRQVRVSGEDGRECFIGSLEDLLISDSSTGLSVEPLPRDLKVELDHAAALTVLVQSPDLRAFLEKSLSAERAAAMNRSPPNGRSARTAMPPWMLRFSQFRK